MEETDDGEEMPKVNMESFTKIMSIPSKYGLTPLKIEEYKLKDDPDVKQAFAHLEERMRDAGADIPDEEEPDSGAQERAYFMSPETRIEAEQTATISAPIQAASHSSSSHSSHSPSITVKEDKKVVIDIKAKSETSPEPVEEKSGKKRKKTKQKQESDWTTYAAAVAGVLAVAALAYTAYKSRSSSK